jgi:hypothetical protein
MRCHPGALICKVCGNTHFINLTIYGKLFEAEI